MTESGRERPGPDRREAELGRRLQESYERDYGVPPPAAMAWARLAPRLGTARANTAPSSGPGTALRRIFAALVSPPTLSTVAAALRGEGDAATRTYRAADISVSVSLGAVAPGEGRSLDGLIRRTEASPLAGHAVSLIATDDAARRTEIDAVGNFAFDAVGPGAYRLEVDLGDQLLTIADLRIGGDDDGDHDDRG